MAAAAAEWEVGPTKDVIQALMETLVDPRLPSRVSDNEPPSEDAQKSIARQMHAVVLLYNYYHRKQNLELELEFLDFMAFCKMALSLRPSLISFVEVSESMEMNSQISSTRKAIKEACDISKALDASKDFPTTKGWPISKVAILLIDSKGENCLLQFGAVTEGVWSLIEKEINELNVDQEILLAEETTGRKRKRNGEKASIDDSNYLQLAYNAVKDFTGIDVSNLEVLESGVVYSLSKEKSAAQFYMMLCPRPFSANQSVPLKFLIESLRGPLAEKDFDSWSTTELVNYYHMLPYVGSISCWLSRKDSCLPAFNGHNVKSNINGGEKELVQIRTPISVYPKYSGKDTDHIRSRSSATKAKSFDKTADENIEDNQSKKAAKRVLSSEKEANVVILESVTNNGKKRKVGPKRGKNDIAMKKLNKPIEESNLSEELKKISRVANSAEKEESGIFCEMLGTDDCKCSSGSSIAEDKSKKLNSKLKVNHHKRTNISSEDGVDLKINDVLFKDENETANKNGIAVEENIEAKNAVVSEDLQNALALLYRKRQELCSQIRTVEDALAICEDNIERIRDGGEVGLARRCIKFIVSGNSDNHPVEDHCNPQSQKKTRLSEIFLPGKSSCQDLEYMCIKNSWRLPRYIVEPSDGKFLSNVSVESKDLKLSTKGEWSSSPREARECAAAQIIANIMKICMKNDDQS